MSIPLKQADMEFLTWDYTINDNIRQCRETGDFHFVRETEMLDENPYYNFEVCYRALKAYAAQL